jgi:DNA replication protein DnaC
MADLATEWARGFFDRNSNGRKLAVLCGPTGVGKTHTAERLFTWSKRLSVSAWECGNWGHPPKIEWVEWGQIVFLDAKEFKAWMDGIMDTDLIFIEDVGAEVDRFKSGEPAERLREVLNEFKNKWAFITSNVLPENWKAKWDERVTDRLMRNSSVMVLRETDSYGS